MTMPASRDVASEIAPYTVRPDATLRDVARCIDQNRRGIALVVDDDGRLSATVTDGDLRRALLVGASMSDGLDAVLAQKRALGIPPPITAHVDTDEHAARALMREKSIRQLPIVDDAGRVVAMRFKDDVDDAPLPISAVVMAGGFGQRLRPLTADTPKPMLPIGDKPILEHIVDGLADSGITDVHVTTHYMPEKIRAHFGDGSAFGVRVRYVSEDVPLGTAGALSLVEERDRPLLVVNGDIMTRVSFRALFDFHRRHAADVTIGVSQYELKVPYGVVESDGVRVRALREKPSVTFSVSAGVSLIDVRARALVEAGERLDMPELVERAIARGLTVVSFPIVEYWVDVGQHGDLERARGEFAPARGSADADEEGA